MKKENSNTQEDLVDRIDLILAEIGKTRTELCNEIGLSLQAIANWKKTKGLPVVDNAINIADFLNVSVDWLIYGKLKDESINPNFVSKCVKRRLETLDNSKKHLFFSQIISSQVLTNWDKGRLIPTLDQIYSIAIFFNISIEALLNLQLVPSEDEQNHIEKSHLFELAKKHSNLLMTYDCMYERDQHYIDMICRRLFKLKRQINGNDFVYPSDPDNPNAQADPNADVQ